MGIEFTQFWKYRKRWHTSEASLSMLSSECLLWNFTELWVQDMLHLQTFYFLNMTSFVKCSPLVCENWHHFCCHKTVAISVRKNFSLVDLNCEIKAKNKEQSVQFFCVQNIEVLFENFQLTAVQLQNVKWNCLL